MTETIGSAVAKVDKGPAALVQLHRNDFGEVLPSHIKATTWVRLAQGALKKGKKVGDQFELEIAAKNNPQAFLLALRDAARLGLEPGTDEYYLTPRKVRGQTEILGIVGYQGFIELMYRAGAISSVVAECVYAKAVKVVGHVARTATDIGDATTTSITHQLGEERQACAQVRVRLQ